ncbi:MAG: dephospho-CoA kinase [Deltaproteobacteria bacterium]|nr:MAG: dephospho-CoA kinase [Deltaproteobacteria bacterium]
MKVIGLTGGIATGKSTVASMLRGLGAKVIDADELAREVVKPDQEAWREIIEAFGSEVLRQDRTLNREKLRKIVFADKRARKRLDSITHPRIRALAQERIEKLAAEGADIIIYEAPLLFENRVHLWLRPVILVTSDSETQKRRLRERDRLSESEIRHHLEAQMPLEEKTKLANFVIDNSGELKDLERQVREVWEKIQAI